MSLRTTIKSVVKTVDKIVKSLEGDVTYVRYLRTTAGVKVYDAPVVLKATVDWKQKQIMVNGLLTVSTAQLIFLDFAAITAATGGEGFTNNDRFILDDGTTGPVLLLGGYRDPLEAGRPFAAEVWLG